jgi:hypothetical protein
MAEQLGGPFEKFVDSPYSKKIPSPHLYKVPTGSNEVSLKWHKYTGYEKYRISNNLTKKEQDKLMI